MPHADDSRAWSATSMQPAALKPQRTACSRGPAIATDAVSYSNDGGHVTARGTIANGRVAAGHRVLGAARAALRRPDLVAGPHARGTDQPPPGHRVAVDVLPRVDSLHDPGLADHVQLASGVLGRLVAADSCARTSLHRGCFLPPVHRRHCRDAVRGGAFVAVEHVHDAGGGPPPSPAAYLHVHR